MKVGSTFGGSGTMSSFFGGSGAMEVVFTTGCSGTMTPQHGPGGRGGVGEGPLSAKEK